MLREFFCCTSVLFAFLPHNCSKFVVRNASNIVCNFRSDRRVDVDCGKAIALSRGQRECPHSNKYPTQWKHFKAIARVPHALEGCYGHSRRIFTILTVLWSPTKAVEGTGFCMKERFELEATHSLAGLRTMRATWKLLRREPIPSATCVPRRSIRTIAMVMEAALLGCVMAFPFPSFPPSISIVQFVWCLFRALEKLTSFEMVRDRWCTCRTSVRFATSDHTWKQRSMVTARTFRQRRV